MILVLRLPAWKPLGGYSSRESRRGSVRSMRLVSVFVLVAAASLFQTTSAFAGTLVVDDDRAQCSGAQFPSINFAVAAANPGDTIKVCPGLYQESVRVAKTAPTIAPTAIEARNEPHDSVPSAEATIQPMNAKMRSVDPRCADTNVE